MGVNVSGLARPCRLNAPWQKMAKYVDASALDTESQLLPKELLQLRTFRSNRPAGAQPQSKPHGIVKSPWDSQSAAAKWAIWSSYAFTKAGRPVARATYSRQAGNF